MGELKNKALLSNYISNIMIISFLLLFYILLLFYYCIIFMVKKILKKGKKFLKQMKIDRLYRRIILNKAI